jgi:putative intracellular protease/amidase
MKAMEAQKTDGAPSAYAGAGFAALALLMLAACARPHASGTSSSTVDAAHHHVAQPESTMKKPILIALTSHDKKGATGQPTGAYLAEIAHPYEVFVAAGYPVEFASVRGGKVPLDGVEREDPSNAAFLDDAEVMRQLETSVASSSVDPARYAAIFFAGGHGAMWDFPEAHAFGRATTAIYERGGIVGAVCHGPAALVNVKLADGSYLVAGKAVSAFTNDEERTVELDKVVPFLLESKLSERGALFQPAPNWQEKVVVADRLVTGQNPASASGVARAMVKLLEGQAQDR